MLCVVCCVLFVVCICGGWAPVRQKGEQKSEAFEMQTSTLQQLCANFETHSGKRFDPDWSPETMSVSQRNHQETAGAAVLMPDLRDFSKNDLMVLMTRVLHLMDTEDTPPNNKYRHSKHMPILANFAIEARKQTTQRSAGMD
eukprot:SAG25_NODE_1650_length_2613_cov_118.762132_2_plen_142_part_00